MTENAFRAELQFILRSVSKEDETNLFSLFKRIYAAEQQLSEFYKNDVLRKKFNLQKPTFSDSVTFGLYSLFKAQKEKQLCRSKNGGRKKSEKYKPYFDFVKTEYNALRQKNKTVSDSYAASKIYEKLFDTFKQCPLTEYSGEETVRKWISKIRKEFELIDDEKTKTLIS